MSMKSEVKRLPSSSSLALNEPSDEAAIPATQSTENKP